MPLIRIRGLIVKPRATDGSPTLFVFSAKAKEIRAWAGVRRIAEEMKGTQRLLKGTRITAMRTFLSADPKNVIPNGILVAFVPGITQIRQLVAPTDGVDAPIGLSELEFNLDDNTIETQKPALVVDGQHRLFGAADFNEDVKLVVVAMLDAPPVEQAFNFIVINNKAVKVDTDIAKSIIADYDARELSERLSNINIRYGDSMPDLKAFNDDDDSPFKGLLDWDYNRGGEKVFPIAAVEQILRHTKSSFIDLADDQDSLNAFVKAVWTGVRDKYRPLWNKDSKLSKKVVMAALHDFIVQRIKVLSQMGNVDIFTFAEITRFSGEICAKISSEYWTSAWKVKIQDNSNVRQNIYDDLETLLENKRMDRPWHEGTKLPNIEDDATGEDNLEE